MLVKSYDERHTMSAEIIITDNDTGKELVHIQAQSFVLPFIDCLAHAMGLTTANVTDTGGVSRALGNALTDFNFIGAQGIVVGTGSNVVVLSDTKLQTQITNGVGAGQLQYGASSFLSPVTVGSDRYFEVSRIFTNSSGASITVNEIGLYAQQSSWSMCFDRTLNTFTINNGGNVTITYRIKVTV